MNFFHSLIKMKVIHFQKNKPCWRRLFLVETTAGLYFFKNLRLDLSEPRYLISSFIDERLTTISGNG